MVKLGLLEAFESNKITHFKMEKIVIMYLLHTVYQATILIRHYFLHSILIW